MADKPVEDWESRKAWELAANIDVESRGLCKRILEALQDRERELERDPSDDRLWREASEILWDLSLNIGHYSDTGLFPENMAKYVADDGYFLGPALEHEVSKGLLADVAREIVALHAQVLNVLRGGEWEHDDEGS